MDVRVLEHVVYDGAEGDGGSIGACNHLESVSGSRRCGSSSPFTDVHTQPSDDLVIVYPVRLFLLLDKLIKEVLLRPGEMLVGAVDASRGALDAHGYNCPERRRANAMDWILVEEKV